MSTENQCKHKTRVPRKHFHDMHTVQCRKEQGHDGMHEAENGVGHTSYWINEGPPPDVDTSTRFRFGIFIDSSNKD